MHIYTARSFEDVYRIVGEIKQFFDKNAEMWFRGQGSSFYKLMPSLLRAKNGLDLEKELFFTYKKLADRIKSDRVDDWETLVNMQHYGIPTRLLDWTDNLGVALYFAATSTVKDTPMSLFIMNPLELNKLSNKRGIPSFPNNPMGLSYITNYVNKEPFPAQYPIAIKSNWINDRIWAQSGMFTIHGDRDDNDIITLALADRSSIYKIDISVDALDSLNEYFTLSGLNEYTLFPDIQGISRHLRDKLVYV